MQEVNRLSEWEQGLFGTHAKGECTYAGGVMASNGSQQALGKETIARQTQTIREEGRKTKMYTSRDDASEPREKCAS